MCGFRAWTRATWLAHGEMLDTTAHWIAWRAAVRGIPILRVRADGRGVTDHLGVNNVYHKSTHTDIGPGFPWDVVMAKAAAIARVPAAPVTPAGTKAPVFPLPKGYYFGPKTGPKESVSGYYSHSADYKKFQVRLQQLGYPIAADGHYDVGKDDAVVDKFQYEHHLVRDKRVGPVTWSTAWTAKK